MFEDLLVSIAQALKENREYTRKWLREFDRSMESVVFTRQLEDLLKETGLL